MFKQVVQSIEVYVSDAAADEIRAGQMLAGQTVAAQASKDLGQAYWDASLDITRVESRCVFGRRLLVLHQWPRRPC